jgi:DNA-binding transcriptional ArsR family regulator
MVRLLTNVSRSPSFRVEAAVTPRFDLFYALHTLTSETPTPLQSWREKAMRRLPREFTRLAKRVAPVPIFWPLLADSLQSTPGAMTFTDIVATLGSMPVDELAANVMAGIFHDRSTGIALLARKKTLRQVLSDDRSPGGELLSHFGLLPYSPRSPAAMAIEKLLSEAESYRDELILVLERFWRSGFSSDWSALEPGLRADAARLQAGGDRKSIGLVAEELGLPVSFDENAGVMRTKSGGAVKLDQIDHCYLLPSAFNTRRWWAKYETSASRVTLYFPVWSGSAAAKSPTPVAPRRTRIDAEAVFRALGDTTRYAIASIIARNPTSSADLSRSLKVSKPTITHHVQTLRSAGLITEEAQGGASRLSLNRGTLAALSDAAVQALFSSTGELQLLTTRKRRR